MRSPVLPLLLLAGACASSGPDAPNPGADGGVPGTDGGGPGRDNDAGTRPAPESCEMDLEVLYTSPFGWQARNVFDPPTITGGRVYFTDGDPAADGFALALYGQDRAGAPVTLVDGVDTRQSVGGVGLPTGRTLTAGPFTEACPGSEQAIIPGTYAGPDDRPVQTLFRISADGRLTPDPLPVIEGSFGVAPDPRFRVSACGDVAVVATLRAGGATLFRQTGGPGSGFWPVMRTGANDALEVRGFGRFTPLIAGTVVTVNHEGGRAIGYVDAGGFRCIATTGREAGCLATDAVDQVLRYTASEDRVLVALDFEAAGFYSLAEDRFERVDLGAMGVPAGLGGARYCAAQDALYFLEPNRGVSELMVRRRDGTVEQLTNFLAMQQARPDGVGGPRSVVDLSVGEGCDVFLSMQGNEGYRGLWTVWADGTVARVIDAGDTVTDPATGETYEVTSWALDEGSPFDFRDGSRDGGFRMIDHRGDIVLGLEYTRAQRRGWLRATKPEDRCRPTRDVNSVGDERDAAPGDGVCDTGDTLADGTAQCTLRAAIEEANARDEAGVIRFEIEGDAPHVIALTTELPRVTAPVSIRAEVGAIVIDGGDAVGGLQIGRDGVVLRGLELRAFASDAIASDPGVSLELDAVRVTGNCGFGVYAAGPVHLFGAEGAPAVVADNGRGEACEGGGIFAAAGADGAVRLEHVQIHDNQGPGVLSDTLVTLSSVQIRGNAAQGVASMLDEGEIVRTRIRVEPGGLVVSDNGGHGLHIEAGHARLHPSAHVEITGQRGWGVFLESGRFYDGAASFPGAPAGTLISNNGAGEAPRSLWGIEAGAPSRLTPDKAPGGGVFAATVARDATEDRQPFLQTIVEDNDGPGILSTAAVELVGAQIRNNQGEGVAIVQSDSTASADTTLVALPRGRTVVAGNRGHGVLVESGAVRGTAAATLEVTGNGGWGVFVDQGAVALGDGRPRDLAQPASVVRDNGAGASCRRSDVDDRSGLPTIVDAVCGGGGVLVLDSTADLVLDHVDLDANQGPGVFVDAPIRALRVRATANSGPGLQGAGATAGTDALRFELGPNVVADNLGMGIALEAGHLVTSPDVDLEIRGHSGWGVALASGDVRLEGTVGGAPRVVADNGRPFDCWTWTLGADGVPAGRSAPCDGGGLQLLEGDLGAVDLTVRDHAGVGIEARAGDLANGDVRLSGGALCDNGTNIAADGAVELQPDVAMSCP